MDKNNIGEQLNKAYEAFRQACMDRDHAVKELQQKTESYTQQICEQQEQIEFQKSMIAKLKSQLAPVNANRGTYSNLCALCLSFYHVLYCKIVLTSLLLQILQCVSTKGLREDLEMVFQEMKEECHRICTLARKQTDQLSKLNIKREPVNEIPFSMPIQCTDKTDEQAEELLKPRVKTDINRGVSCITSITPRGVGQDEEDNSVESLSKFSVKFPPTDNDSTFLQSTPDKPAVPCTAIAENMLPDHHFYMDQEDHTMNLSKLECNTLETHGADHITSAMQNLTPLDITKPPSHTAMLKQNTQDKTPYLKTADIGTKLVHPYTNQDDTEVNFPSSEAIGRAIRGPQQLFWKPNQTQDNNLLAQGYTDSELKQSGICEFCQKVFPPSTTSRGDFLRHLNSHF
uniref:TRAF family member associated NFKB activator n=1 Tax=Chelonoidis abingdonii TaxID=106734 RepID=A0A8C0GIY7_CHEAB